MPGQKKEITPCVVGCNIIRSECKSSKKACNAEKKLCKQACALMRKNILEQVSISQEQQSDTRSTNDISGDVISSGKDTIRREHFGNIRRGNIKRLGQINKNNRR